MVRSNDRTKLIWGCMGFGLAALMALALGAFLRWAPHRDAPPQVFIRQPQGGGRVSLEDGAVLEIQAHGSEPILRLELWVDGERQMLLQPQSGATALPDIVRVRWRPSHEGLLTLVALAIDRRGLQGRSRPAIIEGVADDDPSTISLAIPMQAGDTPAALAERSGLSAELLTGALPESGGSLTLDVARSDLPPAYFGEGAEPVPAQLAQLGEEQPLPEGLPAPPERFSASEAGGCQVRLAWTPANARVRVYRFGGLDQDFELVYQGPPSPAELIDTVPWPGEYMYQVAASGRLGESLGAMARVEVGPGSCPEGSLPKSGAFWMQFEATRLITREDVGRAYCYLSLDGRAFQRVPADPEVFLPVSDDGWDLTAFLGGMHRRVFRHQAEDPVSVEAECWGWRGDELLRLGRLESHHPRQDWNSDLTDTGGALQMLYRLSAYANDLPVLEPVIYEEDEYPPVPTNVHLARGVGDCISHAFRAGGHELYSGEALLTAWACQELDNMLVWDWDPGPGHVQGDIDTFEVAMVGEGSAQSPEVGSAVQAFPVELPPCLEEMEYSVSAGIEGRAGSPWSEPYSSENPNCPEFARVEITLEGLQVDDLDDGCVLFCDGETLQAYGSGEWTVRDTNDESHYATATTAWMTFWTDGCHGGGPGGGCLFAPRTIRNTDYDLALEDIRTCQGGACSDLGPGNNSVRLTVYDGAAVEFRFEMWDSDTAEDDVWCGTIEDRGLLDYDAYALGQEYETAVMVIGPYSLRDWAEFPYRQVEFLWSNSDEALSDHDADCTLTYTIRPLGLMYTASR